MKEQLPQGVEKRGESQLSKEQQERLKDLQESRAERAKNATENAYEADTIRQEAFAEAASAEDYTKGQENTQPQSTPYHNQNNLNQSFNTTMSHTRRRLKPAERTFSKIIHNKAIEKVSDVAGATVARPSGMAGGAIVAFIGVLAAYIIARYAGFRLSGSETLILLIGGFVVGVLVEWFYKSIRSVISTRV